MTKTSATKFAKDSFDEAMDQIGSYDSKDDALYSYYENIRDTAGEQGWKEQDLVEALDEYHRLIEPHGLGCDINGIAEL